ncbi:MAG TPA: FtsX-like permease family protein [Candidatus Limnocylindrales bacterium]|nr:FtsX-like permease family protein [Candidatus Limnocylindrales bacterium]
MTAYDADSSWVGYELISGRWVSAPGEVVLSSRLLGVTGTRIGNYSLLSTENGRLSAKVVGESFDNANDGFTVVGDIATLASIAGNPRRQGFEVGLKPGVDARVYGQQLSAALAGQAVAVRVRAEEGGHQTILVMLALVATLTTLLASVAASGVFNTVVLNTRERVHEIGVLKSLGMTPRQTQTMVLSSVTGIVLAALAALVPAIWASRTHPANALRAE